MRKIFIFILMFLTSSVFAQTEIQQKLIKNLDSGKLEKGISRVSDKYNIPDGTKVKILKLGKAETIDGITSNWVQVEVLTGAKDKDGKEIKSGTTGWCYGGYLE